VAIALLAVVLVLAAAAVTLIVTVPGGRDRFGARAPARSAEPAFPTWAVRYADSLATQRGWSAAADLNEKVECVFRNGRLEIDMRKGGIFRCPGQRDELTDFALRMDVFLLDGQACAGIWFRRGTHEGGKDSSYVLKICRTELVLGHHHADGNIAEFARFRIDELGTGTRSVVGLAVRGGDFSLYLHDTFVGAHHDTAFADGRVALGIAVARDLGAGRVGFSNIELRTP
jgi:eukaryotic-like serine/threonine-protein kinase